MARDAGRDPFDRGEDPDEQAGLDQPGAVAIAPADGIGEPAQLATGASGPAEPAAVAPVEGDAAQGPVVALGARRAAGAGPRNVDLIDPVERARRVRGEEARQPGREPGADDHGEPPFDRLGVEVEQVADIVGIVGHGHHRHLPAQQRRRQRGMRAGTVAEHGDIGGGRRRIAVAGTRQGAEGLDDHRHPVAPPVVEHHVDAGRHQLASGTRPDRARADDECPQRRSGPVSSRHPPPWGGVPPVPRTRSTPATRPASPRATSARRRRVIGVGLGGIEPPTSSLSAMRSNRLSYSPEMCCRGAQAAHRRSRCVSNRLS